MAVLRIMTIRRNCQCREGGHDGGQTRARYRIGWKADRELRIPDARAYGPFLVTLPILLVPPTVLQTDRRGRPLIRTSQVNNSTPRRLSGTYSNQSGLGFFISTPIYAGSSLLVRNLRLLESTRFFLGPMPLCSV